MSLPKHVEALAPKFSWWALKGRALQLAKAAERRRMHKLGGMNPGTFTDVANRGRMSKPSKDRSA